MTNDINFYLKMHVYQKNMDKVRQHLSRLPENSLVTSLLKDWIRAEELLQKGNLREAKKLCTEVINTIESGTKVTNSELITLQASCKMTLGKIARSIGDYKVAGKFYDEAKRLLDSVPVSIDHVQLEFLRGNWSLYLKRFEMARKHHEQSVALARQLKLPPFFEARSIQVLGSLYYYEGEFEKAKEQFTTSLNLLESATDSGSLMLKADIHVNLGTLHYQQDQFTLAKHHFREAIEIYHSFHDVSSESVAIHKVARLNLDMGRPVEALDAIDQFLQSYFSDPETEMFTAVSPELLILRAECLIQSSQNTKAIDFIEEMLEKGSLTTEQELRARDLLVRTLYFLGQHQKAKDQAELLLQTTKSSLDAAVAQSHLALLKIHLSDRDDAIKHVSAAINNLLKERASEFAVDLCLASAIAFLQRGSPRDAVEQVKKEIELRKKYMNANPFQLLALYQDLMVLTRFAGMQDEHEKVIREYLKTRRKILKKDPELEEELPLITSRITKLKQLPQELKEQLLQVESNVIRELRARETKEK